MAFRDRLNSLAAEAASKANTLASGAVSKANTAIENGKLSLKINTEERKIDAFTLNIGELVLDKLDAGETFDDEVMALYSSIQGSREVIVALRAEIDANREAAGEAEGLCPCCGQPLTENANFCAACGAKIDRPQAEETAEEAAEAPCKAPEESTVSPCACAQAEAEAPTEPEPSAD